MSIEQKIADLLAESKTAELDQQIVDTAEEINEAVDHEKEYHKHMDAHLDAYENGLSDDNHAEAEAHAVAAEAAAAKHHKATGKKVYDPGYSGHSPHITSIKEETEAKEEMRVDVSEDVAALINGEELTEEFKTKAATIFEAAVVTRVKQEVAKLEEEYAAALEEQVAKGVEGLVEQVDGYLNYIVEQWIAQNELALEHGMKSEILEGFVSGLKGLFEEHYIEIPEEKFDVLGSMESKIEELETKLNEQFAANVEMTQSLNEMKRAYIVESACEGLSDTEVEKFTNLAEELSYEDAETFTAKVQTIREGYFTTKAQADVTSVVTDTPVETLVEEKKINPTMSQYLQALNSFNK